MEFQRRSIQGSFKSTLIVTLVIITTSLWCCFNDEKKIQTLYEEGISMDCKNDGTLSGEKFLKYA